jgi:hypothetical protein
LPRSRSDSLVLGPGLTGGEDVEALAGTYQARITEDANRSGVFVENLGLLVDTLHEHIHTIISEDDTIAMFAHHMVTRPVVTVLFTNHAFAHSHPMAQSSYGVLAYLIGDEGTAFGGKGLDTHIRVCPASATIRTLLANNHYAVVLRFVLLHHALGSHSRMFSCA